MGDTVTTPRRGACICGHLLERHREDGCHARKALGPGKGHERCLCPVLVAIRLGPDGKPRPELLGRAGEPPDCVHGIPWDEECQECLHPAAQSATEASIEAHQ